MKIGSFPVRQSKYEFNSGKKEAFRKEVEWFVDYQNLFQRRLAQTDARYKPMNSSYFLKARAA